MTPYPHGQSSDGTELTIEYCPYTRIGIIGVSNSDCHWRNRHGTGSCVWQGKQRQWPQQASCAYLGVGLPRNLVHGEASTLIPPTHIPELPGPRHSSSQGSMVIYWHGRYEKTKNSLSLSEMHFALISLIFIKHGNGTQLGLVSLWSDGHETMLSLF